MTRRVSIVFLFIAWLCANGALWNAVQILAWAQMFQKYTETMPVSEALSETFDPEKPCSLCKVVRANTATSENVPSPIIGGSAQRIFLACADIPEIIFTAPVSAWPNSENIFGPERTDPVCTRPPRA